MARLARLAAAGQLHLVLQRGHNGQAAFIDPADRETYRQLLREAAAVNKVAIHAYALTDVEAILLATPAQASGLSRMMRSLGQRYVAGFNRRHGRSGTLWDGRFRATVVQAERHFADCICFVELAPVRAGFAPGAQDYLWSSARHHLGLASDPIVTDHPLTWATGNTPFEREAAHRQLLARTMGPEQIQRVAEAASKGWALGSEAFIAAIQERTGRRARPGRRGRPRKRVDPETDLSCP